MDAMIETLGVLGGAYKAGRANLKVTLTHSIKADAEKALCGQGNIADTYSSSPEAKALPPTCPRCLAKDPRFK